MRRQVESTDEEHDIGCLPSPYPDVIIPEATPLPTFVLDRAVQHGSKLALIDGETGRSLTYDEIVRAVRYVRCGLFRAGIAKGDVVCVCLPNVVEYPIIFHAILSIGGIVTSCNVRATPEEMGRQIRDSDACHLFTTSGLADVMRKAVPVDHPIKTVFVLGGQVEGCISYNDLLTSDASLYPVVFINVRRDLAILPFSSGTTGLPKGVMHTHYGMVAQMCQLSDPSLQFIAKTDVLLDALSMSHAFAVLIFLNLALVAGSTTVVLHDCYDMDLYLRTVRQYKGTLLHVIPPMVTLLIEHPEVENYLTSVHTIVSTAAPLHDHLQTVITERTRGSIAVRQTYGMTEAGATHLAPPDGCPPSSIGKAFPNIHCKVVDVEDGHVCQAHERGELLMKGPQQFTGYLDNDISTAETLDEDGWVHTGDIVRFDNDKNFYVLDRRKEIIRYDGLQVSPAELEALLVTHPAIREAAVVGIPHTVYGELPKAFIVKRDRVTVTEHDLIAFVSEHVSPEKQLRGGVEFIESIPKLISGKILRRQLRKIDCSRTLLTVPTGGAANAATWRENDDVLVPTPSKHPKLIH